MGQKHRLIMIQYLNSNVKKLSAHRVGNKTMEEDVHLSDEPIDISDNQLRELLVKYFLSNFKSTELYSFTFSNEDFKLNPIFNFASTIFENTKSFHKQSINLAKHLYEISLHPNIKSGDLYVCLFSDIEIEGVTTDAIGIFKSESQDSFLKLVNKGNQYSIKYDTGVNIENLDKGCLIFNINKESGYAVSIIDKLNKSSEAQFWRDAFLNIKPLANDYNKTKTYLDFTKNFVTKRLNQEFEVTKTEQIGMLNRSMDYFKNHDEFDEKEFSKEVLGDSEVIKSFRKYKDDFADERNLIIEDDFLISDQAVKKQSRIFKSVLKLDKNFHIYIHGANSQIEKGVEKDGRKFYKIYYREES